MNSFSGVRRALEYEIPRQIAVLAAGGKLVQSTRRWDDTASVTEEMRTKEHAHDYRYFPEPDLMPFEPTAAWLDEIDRRVVELPMARKQRLMREYQLPATDAQTLVWNQALGARFEEEIKAIPGGFNAEQRAKRIKSVANLMINSSVEPYTIGRGHIVELAGLVEEKRISTAAGQQVYALMLETGRRPMDIVEERSLAQVSDAAAIEGFCDAAIAANPGPVADYKAGKAAALNFLKGQVMKLSKGKANPALAGEILERKLKRRD